MLCPFCSGTEDTVTAGHAARDFSVIRRRRECTTCGKRYTTFERIEEMVRLVVKKDGRREQFDRDKLTASIVRVVEKRPVQAGQVEAIVNAVEAYVRDSMNRERPTNAITQFVIERLKEIDAVAYIRYAAGHIMFQDVSDLTDYFRQLTQALGRQVGAIERLTGEKAGRRKAQAGVGEG